MKIARAANTKIILDMDITPSELERINQGNRDIIFEAIKLADIFIPCKAAAIELLGTDEISKNIAKLQYGEGKVVAVTSGSHGCLIFDGDQVLDISGFDVDVVETTGAGDAFHAGFVYGLLHPDMNLEEIGKFANACGAYCCTGIGARYNGNIEQINAILER